MARAFKNSRYAPALEAGTLPCHILTIILFLKNEFSGVFVELGPGDTLPRDEDEEPAVIPGMRTGCISLFLIFLVSLGELFPKLGRWLSRRLGRTFQDHG